MYKMLPSPMDFELLYLEFYAEQHVLVFCSCPVALKDDRYTWRHGSTESNSTTDGYHQPKNGQNENHVCKFRRDWREEDGSVKSPEILATATNRQTCNNV